MWRQPPYFFSLAVRGHPRDPLQRKIASFMLTNHDDNKRKRIALKYTMLCGCIYGLKCGTVFVGMTVPWKLLPDRRTTKVRASVGPTTILPVRVHGPALILKTVTITLRMYLRCATTCPLTWWPVKKVLYVQKFFRSLMCENESGLVRRFVKCVQCLQNVRESCANRVRCVTCDKILPHVGHTSMLHVWVWLRHNMTGCLYNMLKHGEPARDFMLSTFEGITLSKLMRKLTKNSKICVYRQEFLWNALPETMAC